MLHYVAIENYKALLRVELDLDRLTLIAGPNSSGKTSILEAIDAACSRFVIDGPEPFRGVAPERIRNSNSPENITIFCRENGSGWTFQYSVPAPSYPLNPATGSRLWESTVEDFGTIPPVPIRPSLIRFDSKRLAMPSTSENYPPTLISTGYRLASVLAYMALNRPDDFLWVHQEVCKIVPSIRRIRFERKMSNEIPAPRLYDQLVFDMISGKDIPATSMSEGVLLVLGMLAAMVGPVESNTIILVDDIDRGLHPKALKELIAMLRRFLDEKPGSQIVATTHSPVLLNYVRPEEIRVTTLNPDGTTACGRLTNHPNFEEWKDAMAPGEFWSYVGEGWVRDLPVGDDAQ